jgi:drug/metabolite transporter (DMT)-like permease
MVKQNPRAHLSMLTATLLFGINYWIAKGLMPNHLLPMQIIFLRVLGTLIIAWILQMSVKELRTLKIDRADYPRLILSSLAGIAINQMMFFTGLNLTTPVDAAIINSANPILVLLFAAWLLKERIGISQLGGIALGATGALMLVLLGNPLSLKGGNLTGNLFIMVNIAVWSLYLVISKPLMEKYNPILMIRWMFLIGFIAIFPFSIRQAMDINFSSFDSYTWFSLLYIIVGTTFLAYFFITFSLKRLSSSVVAYYTYIQPILVAAIGIIVFAERISWVKIVSGLLVFAGIYFVTRKRKSVS